MKSLAVLDPGPECLAEIGRVEGYDRQDYEKRDDSHSANGRPLRVG